MPTVIDSLIVQLGLDSKDVDAKAPGVRKRLQDIEKAAEGAEKGTKNLGSGIKEAGAALASFLAVIGGTMAIKSFVRDAVDANTQLHFLAQNLDMNVRKIFAFGAAGQEIGVGKGALQGLAASLREIPGQLMAGQQPGLITLLARAGINWQGSSPREQMIGLAKWFHTMPANVAVGIGTSYGLTFDQMEFLLQGAQKVSAQLAQSGAWSPTGKQAAQFAELKRQMVDLGLQWTKLGYDVLSVFAPAIEKLLKLFRGIGEWMDKHRAIATVIAGVAAAIGAFAGLAGVIATLAVAWDMLMVALDVASPVLLVVGAIAALAAGILLLWEDYNVWAKGGKSLFNWSDFAKGIHQAAEAFGFLRDKINAAHNAFRAWEDRHEKAKKVIHSILDFGSEKQFAGWMHHLFGSGTRDETRKLGYGIASAEGYFKKGANNIPQRANNPGDIEWGPWAKAHGATGYITAAGGQKIAVFPSSGIGFEALYAMLGEKRFKGLSPAQAMREYTRLSGSALSSYVSNATSAMNSASMLHGTSGASSVAGAAGVAFHHTVHSTDNSRITNVGTVNIQNPNPNQQWTPNMARGMDLTTILAQSNGGII